METGIRQSKKKARKENIFKRFYHAAKKKTGYYIKEFRRITWCPLKKWLANSLMVILIATVIALMLTGFDYFAQFVTEWIGGLFV